MAALTSQAAPTRAGVVWSPNNVSGSDTVSQAQLGTLGALLLIINGNASSDTVTIADAGFTDAGTAAATYTVSVTNATSKVIYLSPKLCDPNVGTVTITHTQTSSVTYVLLPLG